VFRLLLIIIVLLSFGARSASAQDNTKFSATKAMKQVLSEYIQPGYAQLHLKSRELVNATKRLCQQPNENSLNQTREKYSQLVSAWGGIEMIRFGPILGNNLLERFFFFPDRRGSGLKRIQKLLAKQESKALDPAQLSKISVAAQGLGALDFALYGTGFETLIGTSDNYRCQFAHSVALNLLAISNLLDKEWNGSHEFLYLWSSPGYRNPVFAKDSAAITHILSTIVHGLEVVRDIRLAAFLKDLPKKDRPKSAPLWRSNNTMRLVLANISSVEKIYLTSQVRKLIPEDKKQVALSVEKQFVGLRNMIDPNLNVADALANPVTRNEIIEFNTALDNLIKTIHDEFAATLGLRLGFFFNDGD
jgi:predicted lipoprotein